MPDPAPDAPGIATRYTGYFDHNATTPLRPAAARAWLDAQHDHWHNPSSLYSQAAAADRVVDHARHCFAEGLGASQPERLIFTSGASEANVAVLRHFVTTPRPKLALSAVEHPSVADAARALFPPEAIIEIPVTALGFADLDALAQILKVHPDLQLVSLMAANNETGVIQPWQEALSLCRKAGIPFHCDAAQLAGKLPSQNLGSCDFLTLSAHKFGGPKGLGILLIPPDCSSFCALPGGPQQEARRAGTLDAAAIAAAAAAWAAAQHDIGAHLKSRQVLQSEVEDLFFDQFPNAQIIGLGAPRLWNTLMLLLPEHDQRLWLGRLDQLGFAVSTGAACSSGHGRPSRTLAAMGLSPTEMSRTLRLSAGWDTTIAGWRALAHALALAAKDLSQPPSSPSQIKPKISLSDL